MYNTIIIIPYRDRETHLSVFKRKIKDFKSILGEDTLFVVVEQKEGKDFNRGKLLNIGVKEFSHLCTGFFIFHDVDTFLKNNYKKEYACQSEDIVRLWGPHKASLGGVCKFKKNVILDINGHPNNIWGWGMEDRALFYRSQIKNYKYKTIVDDLSKLEILKHKSNLVQYKGDRKIMSQQIDSIMKKNKEQKDNFISYSGINTLHKINETDTLENDDQYIILEKIEEKTENYVKILVDI